MRTSRHLCLLLALLLAALPLCARTGLVLSGGGARSLASIGVLKVLDEEGLTVDCIAGSSMGAIIGGLYAAGYTGQELEAIFTRVEPSLPLNDISRRDYYIGEKRWGEHANAQFYFDEHWIPRLPRGFNSGQDALEQLFELTCPVSLVDDFDQFPIAYRAVATDLGEGRTEVLNGPSLHEAMRASVSFPTLLLPFELNGHTYVDGGILANLPVQAVQQMGADAIIGVKTNSVLEPPDRLDSVLDVLSQSMNVAMSENVDEELALCDLVLCPAMQEHDMLQFDGAAEIIAAGEAEARAHLEDLRRMCPPKRVHQSTYQRLSTIMQFDRIVVTGQDHLSTQKIRVFTGLREGEPYTCEDILAGIRRAYHSRLFKTIYPVVRGEDGRLTLVIKVQERERRWGWLNVRYNDLHELVLGVGVELNNSVQRNSKLIMSADVGGRKEINLDYVKNFGNLWGGYIHFFPYSKEDGLYIYNAEHRKVRKVKSLENGLVCGVGLFAFDRVTLEGYGFTYNTELYQDVSEIEIESRFRSSGLGLKLYYESLDDWTFPMRGWQMLTRYNTAREGTWSDEGYKRLQGNMQVMLPMWPRVSLRLALELGTYFQREAVDYEPFYIGGMDSFLGYYESEFSAPHYKIYTATLRAEPWRNLFVDAQGNVAKYGNADYWSPDRGNEWGGGFRVGYRTPLGPARVGIGWHRQREPVFYISLGFVTDAFFFSRR